jgi:type I restriction enzyme S subunit
MVKRIKLGELIRNGKALSKTGPFGTQLKASEYVESGVPVINVRNIGMGNIRSGNLEYITEEKACELRVHRLQKDDIVFGRKGAVERHSFICEKEDGWIQGSDCIRLRFLDESINPLFISYFFRTKHHQQWMINLGSFGATMGSLNQEIISKIKIPDIPRERQDEIANILSAYDDLIENNNQRIQLLEEMAAEIYKEWFVRFRFPGYESASFVDKEGKEVPQGTDGALPLGWEKVKIDDGFKILGGGTPSTIQLEYWEEGNINWYSPTDITRSGSVFMHNSAKQITEKGLASSSAKLFPKKSVMMTSRATIGAVGINLTEACTNQGFITCLPNNDFPYTYIYEWIKGNKKLIESFSSGATFKEISRGVFKTFKIIRPDRETMSEYHELVEPIFDELNLLQQKNKTLQETRDLLLPRLISGKLSVENLVLPKETLVNS